jgi:hypothetical protein
MCLLATSIAAPAWAQADKFVPHKNVPAPSRLDVEKAGNSGAVNTNIQFIADRLAMLSGASWHRWSSSTRR